MSASYVAIFTNSISMLDRYDCLIKNKHLYLLDWLEFDWIGVYYYSWSVNNKVFASMDRHYLLSSRIT